jgi:hypothetical protein
MVKILLNFVKGRADLMRFFILTYLDKAVSFALPLAVLFILGDSSFYSWIEVAFSYASIVIVVIEMGLSNYLFWGYKQAVDKTQFMAKARVFFEAMIFLYCALGLLLYWSYPWASRDAQMLFLLIVARTLFMFYVNYYSNVYRLRDTPGRIYTITLLVNLSSFLMLLLAFKFSPANATLYFVIPALTLVSVVSLRFLKEIRRVRMNELLMLVRQALAFSWPIMLNVLLMNFINNYAKIYAFDHLTEAEVVQVSYTLRIGLIIQLGHAAFSSYFSKSLFMDSSNRFNARIFRQYSLVLASSLILVSIIIVLTNMFKGYQVYIPLSMTTFLLVVYIILWCYIGYLEIYFGVLNANRWVLVYSILSSIVYFGIIWVIKEPRLVHLAWAMTLSALLNLFLVIYGLYRSKVLGSNSSVN